MGTIQSVIQTTEPTLLPLHIYLFVNVTNMCWSFMNAQTSSEVGYVIGNDRKSLLWKLFLVPNRQADRCIHRISDKEKRKEDKGLRQEVELFKIWIKWRGKNFKSLRRRVLESSKILSQKTKMPSICAKIFIYRSDGTSNSWFMSASP